MLGQPCTHVRTEVSQRQYTITHFLVLEQLSHMHMMITAHAATMAAQEYLRMMQ